MRNTGTGFVVLSRHSLFYFIMFYTVLFYVIVRMCGDCSAEMTKMYPNKFLQFDEHRIYIMNTLFDVPRESTVEKLIRPPVRSNGRTYKMLVMFSIFFRRQISELPLPIAAKLCHMIGTGVYFIN